MSQAAMMDVARAALENGRSLTATTLTPLISDSWTRCREAGLNPHGRGRNEVLQFSKVEQRRQSNVLLRKLALAEMQLLHSQIAGSNFMIALADREGVVLDTISDPAFASSQVGRSIIPGSVWLEQQSGTNALGLAASTGQPVAVYGREHYFSSLGHLNCMAAPIHNPMGEMIGIIDASCSNEARQQHTHVLVRMAATQIENGLIYQERPESFILAFHPRAEYLDTLSSGLLAVNSEGVFTALNKPAAALLAGLPAHVDQDFENLFEARFNATMDGLLKGGMIRVRDRAGSDVFMVCRQIGARRQIVRTAVKSIRAETGNSLNTAFVCDDRNLREEMRGIIEASALKMSFFVSGESGTGKELMARHVHQVATRQGPFIAVNCGGIPETLFMSELFGYEKGAFTNANGSGAVGLIRAANGGTLFLDEVADIPPAAQTSLLRFLDSMEVRAVGSTKNHIVDVQIICATNMPMDELVAERRFRADLYHRLNGFRINLPALRERTDFAKITRHLVEQLSPDITITDSAIQQLAHRSWAGNIRELKATLQRAIARRDHDIIDENAFDTHPPKATEDACAACRSHPLEKRRCTEIRTVYAKQRNNVAQTARLLGVSRTTVYKHLG